MKTNDNAYVKMTVEELFSLKSGNKALYDALKYVCLNRGFADVCRFANRIVKNDAGYDRVIVDTLSAGDNKKLAKYLVRIGLNTETAIDMYDLFYMCDRG